MNSRSTSLLALLALGLSACLTSMPHAGSSNTAPATSSAAATAGSVTWPHGASAAVSLTYDDAIQSQLDNAVPALARHGLVATFFLTGSSATLKAAPERFRALRAAGHELGSHTLFHPCDRALSFVQPGFALQDYDAARMDAELEESMQGLRDLGQPEPFSFAYPCGSTWIGESHTSYVPAIEKRFAAARGVANRVTNPASDSLFEVPSAPGNARGIDLIDWVEQALRSGGWVVFTFHGVAGDYLAVQNDAHEALLAYLEKNKARVWTERFGTVAQYVKAQHGP
jgi:peptidoglycan/xylan/chitin deacetylase (PgdA/CDA1 family)